VTETPQVGTVEDWVYVNLTADTYPMHTHLVTFQVVGRIPFDAAAYEEAHEGAHGVPGGIDPTPYATGSMEPPARRNAASRTRSRQTQASSPRSGRSTSCLPASAHRRGTSTTAILSSTRTTT
jgi:FtsP/CotA-like multicopper oxidase with cupredoxin domain